MIAATPGTAASAAFHGAGQQCRPLSWGPHDGEEHPVPVRRNSRTACRQPRVAADQ
jgi:hypothetical protein